MSATLPPMQTAAKPARRRDLRWLLAPAVLFLGLLYVLPLLDLFRISFNGHTLWANYARVFSVSLYWDSLVRTLGIAVWVVVICAVFGYPTALLIYRSRGMARTMLTGAIILPYFVAILIRTYALMVLLGRNGPINKLLMGMGVIDTPLDLLFNRGAVLVGISAVLMPLMVLTIYSGFSRIDPAVLRAGRSAGAGPVAVFWRVFFPLSLPAVGAGGLLVFVATLGFFITPTLLGGTGDQMFAMHITQQSEFIESQGFLQALAVVLLVIASIVVALAMHFLGLEFIWGGQKLPANDNDTTRGSGNGLKSAFADAIGWRILRVLGKLPAGVSGLWVTAVGGFVVLALTLPIVVVIIISFSRASFLTFPPPGFSLRWYVRFFSNSDWMTAFGTSVLVAVLSSAISVLIGASAAMAIVRSDFKGKSLVMTALVSPMIVPPVVLGLSLYAYMLHLHLVGTVWGVAMAHSVAGLPLVVVIVSSALQAVDRRQELAASVHGASPWRVFLHVTLPAMAPGLSAAAFFAFLQSFDELVLSLFLAGSSITLLPLRLWADINYQLNPVLAVVSTIEVVLVIVGISFARKTLAGRAQS